MCSNRSGNKNYLLSLGKETYLSLISFVLYIFFPFAREGVAGVSCHQRKSELWGISLEGEMNLPVRAKALWKNKELGLKCFFLPAFLTQSGQILSHAKSTGSSSTSLLRKYLENIIELQYSMC